MPFNQIRFVLALPLWLFFGGPLLGQTSAIDLSINAGKEAVIEGRFEEAFDHFVYALSAGGDELTIIPLLVEASEDDNDAQELWISFLFSRLADKFGDIKGLDYPNLERLSRLRVQSFKELVKFRSRYLRSKKVSDHLIAAWASDLISYLVQQHPHLKLLVPNELVQDIVISDEAKKKVIKGLSKEMRNAQNHLNSGKALKYARCLKGLSAQSNFKDLKGPTPTPFLSEANQAESVINEVRGKFIDSLRVYSIEELQDMDVDAQRLLTLEHASFENPAVCYSPNNLYRIETTCGYNTLLGTAETIELHHNRLLNYFGRDPFNGRQGLVRVVPESYGLESEGAGFYWVGGFQGGDITTVKFTIGTIPGLGKILTHELTHRFDGAIYGGLPAWLAEGKAVWTESSYGEMIDENFVSDYVNFGTLFAVAQDGYGQLDNLQDLLSGQIEDYRDNYSAGYALFAFLNSWTGFEKTEKKIFFNQLSNYQVGLRKDKGSAIDKFTSYFCDGLEGRPESLAEFAEDFDKFLKGFYWKELASWTKRYSPRPPAGETAEVVEDEPTFSWLRSRAEPWFGQDQARVAALLLDSDKNDAAGWAYHWALAVDEPSDAFIEEYIKWLERNHYQDAAWCLKHWPRYESPLRNFSRPTGEAVFIKQLPKTREWLEELVAQAEVYLDSGFPRSASALSADLKILGEHFGLFEVTSLPFASELSLGVPFVEPPRALHLNNYLEYELSGYDKDRTPNMWFVDEQKDLHVGRNRGRAATGTMDRTAYARTAVVFSDEWQQPGRYRIFGKIEQTTTYFSGGIVFGWARRDRNMRLAFSGGDYRYSIGETEESEEAMGLSWSLNSLFVRDNIKRGGVGFDSTGTTWSFEIIVDGPTAEIYLGNKLVQRVSMLNGRPIQGRIGFYTTSGAMRVIAPKVQRLDRQTSVPEAFAQGWGFDPQRKGEFYLRRLLGLPMSNVPLSGSGTVVLLYPEADFDYLEESLQLFADSWTLDNPAQGLTVLLPKGFDSDELNRLQLDIEPTYSYHSKSIDDLEISKSLGGRLSPVIFFTDPAGIIRYAKRLRKARRGLPDDLMKLVTEYQDHTRSGMAGAGD